MRRATSACRHASRDCFASRVNHSHARTRARKWGKEGEGEKNKGDRYGWMEEGISTLVGGHAREDINVVRWR